jgi:hypothetical protein
MFTIAMELLEALEFSKLLLSFSGFFVGLLLGMNLVDQAGNVSFE